MTPDEFISKWSAVTLTERSAAQSHFIDLCAMLSVPTPTDADPKGTFYTFEKLTDKDTGHRGFADVWYQGQFAWEYKKKRANLDDALIQLRQYSGALGNPPLLVVCDMGRIRVVPQFTGYVTTPIDIAITDLADARVRETLRHLWNDPNALKPTQTREGVTLEAARQFGIIADRLRSRDATEPHTVAHFLIRVLFCLFAENIRLLPHKHFSTMLERFRTTPEGFMRRVATIFGVMATGGEDGNEIIPYFNGDLFTKSTDEVLKLQKDDLTVLSVAASHDWSSVAPSIFGTLFERGLDPSKRSQIGAHYTSEADIIDVVEPVVMAPLRRHWNEIRTQLEAQVAQNKLRSTEASKLLRETIYAISQTTVLDPACGSGNFLYVTLKLLHELEFEIITWHIRHNLLAPYPSVGPQQLYGIEINTYAAELARAVIWIGHLQWMLEHGYGAGEPVLQRLDNIVNTDALINVATGTITEWPKVTCIVSNPPFLGSKRLRIELGDEYMDEIWKKYDTLVSRESDLVCYFVEHARHQLVAGKVQRVGLITTNSIRGGPNRKSLERIKETNIQIITSDNPGKTQQADLFMAWADRPWVLDGAAVRISIIGFDNGQEISRMLNGTTVGAINADLTTSADLTKAKRLVENVDISFQGTIKGGAFDITSDVASPMIQAKGNPNGRPNSDVVKPWVNGLDIVRRPRNMWIIDFNTMLMDEAALYEQPFEFIKKHVYPKRMEVRREHYRTKWWLHGEARPGFRQAILGLPRYIITPRVAKHRIFIWVQSAVIPDSATIAIARDDDYAFGVLHSHAHELWSLRMCTWLGVGNDPRYTPTTCFETFPFPKASAEQQTDIAEAAKRLVTLRDNWLNPPEATAAELKNRTLTALYNANPQWLQNAHTTLNLAVYRAYGWADTISDDAILEALLAENLSRAGKTTVAMSEVEDEDLDTSDGSEIIAADDETL